MCGCAKGEGLHYTVYWCNARLLRLGSGIQQLSLENSTDNSAASSVSPGGLLQARLHTRARARTLLRTRARLREKARVCKRSRSPAATAALGMSRTRVCVSRIANPTKTPAVPTECGEKSEPATGSGRRFLSFLFNGPPAAIPVAFFSGLLLVSPSADWLRRARAR